jgi:hypothetical protein
MDLVTATPGATPAPGAVPTPAPNPAPVPAAAAAFVNADGTFAEGWLQHEKIDPALRKNKTLSGVKSVPEMAAMLVNAETLIGKKRLVQPESDQDTAALDALYHNVGWPEAPEKYPAFTPPAGVQVDPEMDKTLRQWCHALRATPAQYLGLAQQLAQFNLTEAKNQAAAAAQAQEQAVTAQKNEWGGRYDYNVQLANTAAAAFTAAAPQRLERMQAKGYLADPDFLAFCKEVGEAVAPDRLHIDSGGRPDKVGIQQQIEALETSEAYRTPGHAQHESTTNQVLQLRAQLLAAR